MTMASSSSSSNNNQSGALGVGVCIAGGNNDLWRECVAWLTRCKIIPADHKANWPDSEIRVLALTLRDGVLLCNLVIYLDASSMDPRDFNRKPQMAQAEAEAAKFEEAISACSFGRFNLFLMLIVLPGTAAILFASSTMSYVLPSAQCDLKLSIMQKGYLNMITYVGMLVSVLPWAAASDIYGRRKVLITSHICDAIFVLCSALCPEFYSLLLFKLLNDENWIFSIAGGFSALITYVSEVHGSKHRQHLILFVGLSITFASVVLPILAIIILPYRWEFNFLWMTFRAWNLFIVVVACPSLLCGVGFIYFPESPKYLMYNKKYKAGEAVFEKIFHLNTRKPAEEFRVKLPADPPSDGTGQMDWKGFKEGLKNLKIMVRREYLWQAIIVSLTDTAVAMCQNTLRLWMPQLFALSKNFENENNYSITQLLDKNKEEEQFIEEEAPNSNKCFMELTTDSFINNIALTCVSVLCFTTALLAAKKVSPKFVLNVGLAFVALFGYLLNLAINDVALTIIASLYLGLEHVCTTSCLNCVVSLFPTQIRNTAVSVVMFCGRIGSIIGNIIFPWLIKNSSIGAIIWLGSVPLCGFIISLFIKNPMNAIFK